MNQSSLYHNRFQYLLWVLLAIALFNMIFSIEYFIRNTFDDVFFAKRAYTQWTEDFFTTKSHYIAPLRTSILHASLYGPIMTIFDESMYAHRYVSLALSIVALTLIFQVFKRLSNTQTALATVVVFTLVGHFVSIAHTSRPDILVVTLSWFSLWLQSRSDNQRVIFASATLAGIAVVVHPIGILAIIAMLTYRVFPLNYKQLQRDIRPIGAGFVLAGIIFVLDNFPYLSYLLSSEYHTKSLDPHIMDCWLCRLNFLFFIPESPKSIYIFIQLSLPLILLILIWSIDRITGQKWDMATKKCLLLFLAMLIGMLMLGRLIHNYTSLFTPFLWFVIISRMFAWKKTGKIAYVFLVAPLLAMWVAIFIREGYQFDSNQYIDDVKKISAPYINEKITIIGPPLNYLLFRDHQFHDMDGSLVGMNWHMKNIGLPPCNTLIQLPAEYSLGADNFYKRNLITILRQMLSDKTGSLVSNVDGVTLSLSGNDDNKSIRSQFLNGTHKVGQVHNKDLDAFGSKKGNILEIYYRPSC